MLGFLKSGASGLQVGVDFLPTGVALVGANTTPKRFGQVRFNDFLPAVGASEQAAVLKSWVHLHGLEKTPCVSLIAKHDVQMFQLEKPAVEDSELLQAVNWKIQDMISYDIELAVVDIYEFPVSPKNSNQHINAVVANETVVGSYVERIKKSGLELQAIDVHDLVSRNFQKVVDFSDRTTAILQFSDHEGMLTVYLDGDLYVARDFKIGLLEIETALDGDEAVYDKLLLELQRSMDYFENYYGHGLVQQMLMFPQTPGTERMATYLQNYVAYELDFVNVEMDAKSQGKPLDTHCFSAYCAALRGREA